MSSVIKVENLSKQYRLGEVGTGTISHDLNRWWHKIRGKEDPYLRIGESNDRSKKGNSEYVWALQDINFEVQQGEVLGIIGKNGAGKSTLLKILSKVTAPTTGSIKAKGRIAALLEVGTGFHPELTGRENIYLNGTILGMSKREVSAKLDEIVDFAGVERYLDTPVKRYSSGMMVRLGFAVAAHLEPEILIVDEVLAVGDAEFQSKAIGKMQEVSSQGGRTVLFVSHNMGSIKSLCGTALLMQNGSVTKQGKTSEIIEQYLSSDSDIERYHAWPEESRPGDDYVKLECIKIVNNKGSIYDSLFSDTDVIVQVYYEILKDIRNLRVVANFLSFDGVEIFSTSDFRYQDEIRLRTPGKYSSCFTIPKNTLNVSRYFVSVDIDIPLTRSIVANKTLSFSIDELIINELGQTIARKPSGVIHPVYPWAITKIA